MSNLSSRRIKQTYVERFSKGGNHIDLGEKGSMVGKSLKKEIATGSGNGKKQHHTQGRRGLSVEVETVSMVPIDLPAVAGGFFRSGVSGCGRGKKKAMSGEFDTFKGETQTFGRGNFPGGWGSSVHNGPL